MRMRIFRLFDEKLFLHIILYKLHILCKTFNIRIKSFIENVIIFLIQNINCFSSDFLCFNAVIIEIVNYYKNVETAVGHI